MDVRRGYHVTQLDLRVIDRVAAESLCERFAGPGYEQRCSYAEVAARAVSATCEYVAIERDGEPVGYAAVRIKRVPVVGFGLAYVHRGPVCDPKIWADAVDALVGDYVTRRRLLLRIAPPIAIADAATLLKNRGFAAGTQPPYRTLMLDLARPLDEIRKSLHPKWRTDLSRGERNALHIIRSSNPADFARFQPLFTDLAASKGFSAAQGPGFFADVAADARGSERIELHLALHEGQVVAGHVGSYSGDTAVYLLGAASAPGRDLRAAFVLQWAAIERAHALALSRYDLGGIDEVANPDVFRFKQRMGGAVVTACPNFDRAPGKSTAFAIAIAQRVRHTLARSR